MCRGLSPTSVSFFPINRARAKKTRTVPSWVFLRYRNSTFISSLYLSTVKFLDSFPTGRHLLFNRYFFCGGQRKKSSLMNLGWAFLRKDTNSPAHGSNPRLVAWCLMVRSARQSHSQASKQKKKTRKPVIETRDVSRAPSKGKELMAPSLWMSRHGGAIRILS